MEIYRADGKKVGSLIGDTYYSPRNKTHFMIKFQGFGISEKILYKDLRANDCTTVIIDYDGTNGKVRYKCSLNLFIESNKIHIDKENDIQRFVSIKDMEKI